MWLVYAFGSAFFAGITAILAKCGIRRTDSTVATAVRTCVVLVFSWAMVGITGVWGQLPLLRGRTLVFLVLSGLATGGSWLCYFKALQLGDINKVVPIDKSSTVLTILLGWFLLGETVSPAKALGAALLAVGTLWMIEKRDSTRPQPENRRWLPYAAGSAVLASLTAILGKVGISGVDSNLGTAVRTCVVLVMAWGMVLVTGKGGQVGRIPPKELGVLCLSGLATGASWLCYYRALQQGPASLVVPIDKLSILVTVAFSRLVFGEKLSRRAGAGLALVVTGTLVLLL